MKTMKKAVLAGTVLVLLFCFSLLTRDVVMAKEQTTCPVMGGQVDKNIHMDYNGKRVYFCCPKCVSTFKKDPEKYVKKMKKEGVELEKAAEKAGKGAEHTDHSGHNH